MDTYLAGLETERINEDTRNIDTCTTLEMVEMINRQDAGVAAAVAAQKTQIAQAIDLIVPKLKSGGRLIYLGAGTSGRLGVLDASECVPTFGVSPELVQGYIAGGDTALRHAAEGCEDSTAEGEALIERLDVGEKDAVVGITASGSAAFVLAALQRAKTRGAAVIGLCTNPHTRLEALCDVCIAPEVGPEVITGSTRMKSGTAQKMVLNMLSTCAMVHLGKVYGNLMVDLRASNKKLEDRACRLVMHAAGTDADTAARYLALAGGHVKLAILMLETQTDAAAAQAALDRCEGHLAAAIDALGRRERSTVPC